MNQPASGLGPELSIVVPVWNEHDNIDTFLQATDATFDAAGLTNVEYVFVDDGSTDDTWAVIERHCRERNDVIGVKLSRNWGKEAALEAGLRQARGRAHVPMDVDLQDPPEVVVEMYRRLQQGARVVVARRRRRDEGIAKQWTASAFYFLAGRGTHAHIPPQVGDFRIMDATVTERYLALSERARFNKGLLAFVASDVDTVEFDRPNTRNGRARQSWTKLIRLGLDGLVSFTDWPLRMLSTVGFGLVLLSIIGAIVGAILRLMNVLSVPGQTTVILMGLFVAGFQAFAIGVLGEYIARIMIEVKGRPLYFIDQVSGAPYHDDR